MGPSQAAEDRSNAFVYHFMRMLIEAALRFFFGQFIINRKNVPKTGAVLLVANHQSLLDPPLIGSQISHRRVEYLAKASLFKSFFGRAIGALGAVPVKEDGQSDTAAIKEILRRLREGHAVLVFPEGERTTSGKMNEFKRGAALLVKRSKCPVVPIGVDGCHDAWPRGQGRPSFWGVRIGASCGEPISHDELMAGGSEAAMARLFDEVDRLRLQVRKELRHRTGGRFPQPGVGDGPTSELAADDADDA